MRGSGAGVCWQTMMVMQDARRRGLSVVAAAGRLWSHTEHAHSRHAVACCSWVQPGGSGGCPPTAPSDQHWLTTRCWVVRTCIILTAQTVSTSCTEKMTVSPFSVLSAISSSMTFHRSAHCSAVPVRIMVHAACLPS